VTYSLTVFESIFDNKTDKRFDYDSWEKFERVLYTISEKPGRKAKRGEKTDKKASPLISPAIYTPNSTRANANVEAWAGWAALDVDNYNGSIDAITKDHGFYCVCYSTASSTKEKPKFRLVFPLSGQVPAAKIRHFWYALNKEFGSVSDEQTKDLSRMYYVPAKYPKAHNFIFTVKGRILDPNELMAKYAYAERSVSFIDRLPDNIKKAIMTERKERMNNTSVEWNSYRDCPFVNKKLISDYKAISMIDGSGRYRMIFKIMTSIACSAVKRRYPITADEVAELVRQLDSDSSRIYQNRPLKNEADRAIEFAYKNASPF
jgi:hypothetical protein